jgi:hypothetical protein
MDALQFAPVTLTTKKAGLTNGTGTSFSFTANPLEYLIKGKFYSKVAQTNTGTPATDGNTGAAFTAIPAGTSTAAYGSVYVWAYDAAGNVKLYQGTIAATDLAADGANARFIAAPAFPSIPDNVSVFGYTVVKVGTSGAAFTPGSNSLASGSNISVTHVDVGALPDRPQVA